MFDVELCRSDEVGTIMQAIADTDKLVADGIITASQAAEIEARARDSMVQLAINALLCSGIVAATAGLILFLASALAVAVSGGIALGLGLFILFRGGEMFRMFGNASTLIGAGMLIGGASVELLDKYEPVAGLGMALLGALIAVITGASYVFKATSTRFVTGAILLMGVAMHIFGVGFLLHQEQISGPLMSLFYLYVTGALIAAGWVTDVRLVTALAIAPFAQVLDTGTYYFTAAYVFYSPEATLSILQMSALIGLCLWLALRLPERSSRHAVVLAVMAFIVANLCALVGSIWGDVVGETIWGPGSWRRSRDMSWEDWSAAQEAFRGTTLIVSEQVYAIIWAMALAVIIAWSTHGNRRGLFNTALTFAGIHGYTQVFESFYSEPLAYVIGGLAAIPLAWGIWRLNLWIVTRANGSAKGVDLH
ncbi:hypothetical protein [uncultured Shimia sp.]|uniref:hypothetical protein n=1 Tax=uncultured Shimia sp. TaxID=573152 RepID=UPI00261CC0FE|nr:hypothetical protein [uncultured Shimia sp.]